jgi:hypothetical protein
MRKTLFFFLLLLLGTLSVGAQIQTIPTGGYWHDPNTWIGGIVPGAGDDVIITAPVVHQSVSGYDIITENCRNLTITASGSLRNGPYGGGFGVFPLIVHGSVVNNGTVENGSEDVIKIFIQGDLTNNNIWMPYQTEFQTAAAHNLSLAAGKSLGSKIINADCPSLTAQTDMLITCDFYIDGVYQRDNFFLNGKTFNVGNHKLELRRCMINSGILTGDFEILGTMTVGWDVNDTLIFQGNITVTDTLTGNVYNAGYGIYKLEVIGDLTNNGVIKDDYDLSDNQDDLNLLITGNIINNGVWTCNFVTLIGAEKQYIFQQTDKKFDSYFSDFIGATEIEAQSDITITKDFDLNGATLRMEGHTLAIDGWLKDGFVSNTQLKNGYLQDLTSIDNLTTYGTVTVDENNDFQGTAVINGTLQSNDYGAGSHIYKLLIDGDITNNGTITNINNGDVLSLEVKGNITNNGLWEAGYTKFTGTQDQTISQATGKVFQSEFSDLDSLSKVLASSDIKIAGNYNLMRSTLHMNDHEIDVSGNLYNGYILSPKIRNATLINDKVSNDIEIRGIVVIDDGNEFRGNVVVTDTLQAQAYNSGSHTYILDVYGKVQNNGVIRNEPTQNEQLLINIHGDIINKGVWTNSATYQRFFPNDSTSTFSFLNIGSTDWSVGEATITGGGAAAFSIITGGGAQTVAPNQSYVIELLYTPARGDSTATLNIPCTEIGTLNTINLIGHTYNTPYAIEEGNHPVRPEVVLYQNHPNPVTQTSTISWQTSANSNVVLKVFDFTGRETSTLVDGQMAPGMHSVSFDATGLPAGVYFYQLRAGNVQQTGKMVISLNE